MNADLSASPAWPTAGLWRRLGAMLYDSLLLLGVVFVAEALLMLFTGGRAIPNTFYLNSVYLLAICFLFFGWFWTHGGQTLGMRAWKLRVEDRRGGPIGWRQALLRFAVALGSWAAGGLGFLWMLADRERLTWHDRASGTRLVLLKAPPGPPA